MEQGVTFAPGLKWLHTEHAVHDRFEQRALLWRRAFGGEGSRATLDDRTLGREVFECSGGWCIRCRQEIDSGAFGDEGTAATTTPRLDQPRTAKHDERAAQRDRRDAKGRGQLHLGRQTIAGSEQPKPNRLTEPGDRLGYCSRTTDGRKDRSLDKSANGLSLGLWCGLTHASSTSMAASSIISSSS